MITPMELTLIVRLGILLRVFALALVIVKVIPKQYTECCKYKNGLRFFRILLLMLGNIAAFSIVAGIFFVLNSTLHNPLHITPEIIALIYSASNLATALLLYLIYNGRDGDK